MELRQLIAACSGAGCLAAIPITISVCVLAYRRDTRLLAYLGAAANCPLGVVAIVVVSTTWSRACGVLDLLLAAQAAAIVLAVPRPLAAYARDVSPGEEPSWWPTFERQFRVYCHEGDGCRRAGPWAAEG